MRCFCPLRNLLPSAKATAPRLNLRCRNPWEAVAAENRPHWNCDVPVVCCIPVWDKAVLVADRGKPAADRAFAVEGMLFAVVCEKLGRGFALVFDCGGRSRQLAEYNGYTYTHLPGLNWVLFRKDEANAAIFAARIAFSSFDILGALK